MNNEKRASILIVDDLPDNLRTLSAILSKEGYKVRKAVSGQMAIETVRSQLPDLILLDIKMPQMDGYEVCSTLKAEAKTRDIPVIFLSALDEAADKVKAFTVGGVDYICKPFQAEEVIARIENQVRIQRLSKQLIEQNARLENEIRTRQQTEVILQQEIDYREKAEKKLQHKSQILANFTSNLKQLHRLNTSSYNSLEERFADYLETGCQILGFTTGIISQIDDQIYTILAVTSDLEYLKPNLDLNLSYTYCTEVIKTKLTIAYAHVGKIAQMQRHLVYQNLKLESYIGTPIFVNGEIYGTLNFSSTEIRRQDFAEKEKEFIELMAQSIGSVIATYQAQIKRQQAQDKLHQAHTELEQRAADLMVVNTQLQSTLTELKKSEANLAEAQRVAHVGNWEYDVFIQEITCSEELSRIFGFNSTESQLTYAKLIRLIHPEDRAKWQNIVKQAIASGNSYEFDFRIVRSSGEMRHVEVRVEAVFNDAFEVKSLFGTILDITDRKQAENSLRESETLYRQMFEANQAVKFLINPESGAIVDANPAAYRFYGYKLEDLKHKKITDLNLLPPDQVLRQMAKTVSRQQGEMQFCHRLASGEIRDVAVYSSPITRQGKQLIYSIIHDITKRRQAEEALRQSEAREREKAQELKAALEELKATQAQLIHTEKMSSLGRMVAGVAHEINNPVGFISGNLTVAREYFQDILNLLKLYQQSYPNPLPAIQQFEAEIDLDFLVEDWPKLMDSMQVGAERIQEIVQSLKNFSRLNEAELKAVDIHQGIDNTLLLMQPRIKAVSHTGEIEVIKDYGQLPLVTCYASQLNQVFMNLINNAIDAVATQTSLRVITIHTSLKHNAKLQPTASCCANTIQNDHSQVSNPQSVLIRISDNGPGMSKEIQQKIFDPFFTTKPVGSGTGLGLSISHQIVVEKHGGQLSCISTPGHGTEFMVEIPMLAPPCT